MCVCAYMCVRAYGSMHAVRPLTSIHAYTHTCIHAYMAYKVCIERFARDKMCMCMYVHVYVCVQLHGHTCAVPAPASSVSDTYMHISPMRHKVQYVCCVCMHACMYDLYRNAYIHTYVHTYIHTCQTQTRDVISELSVCMFTRIYIICKHVNRVYAHACVHIYVYIYICIHIHIHTYTYIHTHKLFYMQIIKKKQPDRPDSVKR